MAVINVKQLAIYLAGVSLIVNADVSQAQRWIALVLLLVVIQLGVLAAVAADVFAPDWASRVLGALHGWLVRNNRVIGISIGVVIGGWFTIKGITQIAG